MWNLKFFSLAVPVKLATIHLYVKDINDEKPIIINKPRPFLATVSTNPRVGEFVYELVAYDPDTNSDVYYNLESGIWRPRLSKFS